MEPHFPVRNGDHGYGPYGNPAAQFRKGNVEVAIFVDNMREKMIIVEGMVFSWRGNYLADRDVGVEYLFCWENACVFVCVLVCVR